ncbi:MAG: anti-sigma factor [Acidimicrobiales bacterium]|nr:anti-sigma factor [Acidimicrobiales bacterium]
MSDERMTAAEHAEIQSLLGAYALDATSPEESARVEEHLRTCVRCAAEVDRHFEVAGLLANSGGEAPDHLWAGIAERLGGSGPPSWQQLATRLEGEEPEGDPATRDARPVPIAEAGHRRSRRVIGGLVAAAAVVLVVGLGVEVAHLHHQLNTPALTRAEQAALAQPSTVTVRLTTTGSVRSGPSATVVLAASGTGFVEGSGLSALPSGRTYQLWGVIGGRTVSLGLLGAAPGVVPFTAAGHGGMHAFAISDEAAGGAVAPTGTPVVEGATRT